MEDDDVEGDDVNGEEDDEVENDDVEEEDNDVEEEDRIAGERRRSPLRPSVSNMVSWETPHRWMFFWESHLGMGDF